MKAYTFFGILLFATIALKAQFAPGVGKPGTTAMHKDSSAFVAWAVSAEIFPGPQQMGVDSLGFADVGTAEMALGKAGSNGVVSLGDGGSAVMQFARPVRNGESWDFAVFENSYDGLFLELAFVEVSSDGERFVRFPAASLTDTSKVFTGFDTLYPQHLNNLAGKYPVMYGTPFDLEELKDSAGLDVSRITHIRVVDVVGTANPVYCSRDASGRIVRDPWPTPFAVGGFDLDAVGVIHQEPATVSDWSASAKMQLWPQPAVDEVCIRMAESCRGVLRMYDLSGALIKQMPVVFRADEPLVINELNLNDGLFLFNLQLSDGRSYGKKLLIAH